MKSKSFAPSLLLAASAFGVGLSAPRSARACGGFFCSSPNLPINQAAEKIIFSTNGDGTVTAIIQIAYQGPAPNFSWLLPISSVPTADQIGVASNLAFQRLQNATNPQYSLTVSVEGTCSEQNISVSGSSGTGGAAGSASLGPGAEPPRADVTVDASGTIGAFEYKVISVNPMSTDAAEAAVTWLTTNGYNVSEGAPGLIRPYLQDGMHLLALRLSKGADSGSIRPIMLTYSAKAPMIPIKLTAVAANDNMGVMTWLLGSARGVPQNYDALELNEARINWFNASSNYNDVVNQAANESSGGHGFVTEYADKTKTLANVVWSAQDEAQWQSVQNSVFSAFNQIFDSVYQQWGQWDGFWDAMRSAVTLPAGVTFADFRSCPNCYEKNIQFAPSALFAALQTHVIQPVKDVQALLDRNAYVTRLYTTMSAAEMTTDPLFTYNAELPAVSNNHVAKRVIECGPGLSQFQAPWRIELPSGGVIRGVGSQLSTWPTDFASLPSNARILRLAATGPGDVIEDNAPKIQLGLQTYNAGQPAPPPRAEPAPTVDDGGTTPATAEGGITTDAPKASGSGGCSATGNTSRAPSWTFAALCAGLGIVARRRYRLVRKEERTP